MINAPKPVIRDSSVRGQIKEIRSVRPPNVAVLYGPNSGVRKVEAGISVNRLSLWLGEYNTFYVVDTSYKTIETDEAFKTRDNEDIQAKIVMRARVIDSEAFINGFGPDATLIEPFYEDLVSDLKSYTRQFLSDDIDLISADFEEKCSEIRDKGAIHDCIFIDRLSVNLLPSERHQIQNNAIKIREFVHDQGIEILDFMASEDPNKAKKYNDLKLNIMQTDDAILEQKTKHINAFVNTLKALKDTNPDELRRIQYMFGFDAKDFGIGGQVGYIADPDNNRTKLSDNRKKLLGEEKNVKLLTPTKKRDGE